MRSARMMMAGFLALLIGVAGCDRGGQEAGQQEAGMPAVTMGADPTAYIPAGMDLIMKVDWTSLKNQISEESKKEALEAIAAEEDPASKVIQAMEVDIFEDIYALAVGASLDMQEGQSPKSVFALSTNVTLQKMASALQAEAAQDVTVAPFSAEGLEGYTLSDPADPSGEVVYLIERDGLLLGSGQVDLLNQAIQAKASGQSAFSSGPLTEGLGLVNRSAQGVLVLGGPALSQNPMLAGQGGQQIQVAAFSMNFVSQALDFLGVVKFGDASAAEQTAQQIQGLMGMFMMNPDAQPMLQKVKIESDGDLMKITAKFTEKELKDFVEKQQEAMQPM